MKNSHLMSPPYKNKAFKLGASLVATAGFLSFGSVAYSATILSTDFDGRTISGNTASNITYVTNGVGDPGDLSADSTLFDTPDTNDLFAVQRNLHTQGPWVVDIPITVGSQDIQLDQISLDAFIFSGAGGRQSFSRDYDMTIELLDSTQTVTLNTQSVNDLYINSDTVPNPSPVPFVFDFSSSVLSANTTFFLRLTASGTGPGTNAGFDNFILTGDLIAMQTPEATSAMTLIALGALGVAGKLKKKASKI